MLQLDYMEDTGRTVSQDIYDEHYATAVELFRQAVERQEYQLVYLWLCDNDRMKDDRVVIRRWVRP